MILLKEKTEEMLEAAKPLMKWLADNCHPHCEAVVDCGQVELLEGVASVPCAEFIRD